LKRHSRAFYRKENGKIETKEKQVKGGAVEKEIDRTNCGN
jgi:hypothetical protein